MDCRASWPESPRHPLESNSFPGRPASVDISHGFGITPTRGRSSRSASQHTPIAFRARRSARARTPTARAVPQPVVTRRPPSQHQLRRGFEIAGRGQQHVRLVFTRLDSNVALQRQLIAEVAEQGGIRHADAHRTRPTCRARSSSAAWASLASSSRSGQATSDASSRPRRAPSGYRLIGTE